MTSGQRTSPSNREDQPDHGNSHSAGQTTAASALSHELSTSTPLHEDRLTDASPPVPGFLGPTSYSAVFTEGQSHISIESGTFSREMNLHGWQPPKMPSWDSNKVNEGAEVLALLAGLQKYKPALNLWSIQCLATITPYVRECIDLTPSDLKDGHGQSKSLATLSHKAFLKTSTPYSLDTKVILREYPSFLMRENLSWEIVGIMLTALGLSAMSLDEVNIFDEADSRNNWKDLAQ